MSDIEPKKRHLHIGALIVVIALVFILFKFNLEKAINSPQFQSNVDYIQKESTALWLSIKTNFFNFDSPINQQIDAKIQPDKIKNYFGVPSEDNLNQLSSPSQTQ